MPAPPPPITPPSPAPPPPTQSTLTALQPNKHSTLARLYLTKYRTLHSLSQTLLTTASNAYTRYLHHGCLCFIHQDLSRCHRLITQHDGLATETRAHAHDIETQSFGASETHERLRRRHDKLMQQRDQMRWELVSRQGQLDAQRDRWNGIIRDAMRMREITTPARVGLMMCHARHGLAEQAVRKQEGRVERMSARLARSWERVDRARRLAAFLGEYDECLQCLQWYVGVVAGGIGEKVRGMVEEGEGIWGRKGGEHRALQRRAGDVLECPVCLGERWSGRMEFGDRLGWFGAERTSLEKREIVRGRERAASV